VIRNAFALMILGAGTCGLLAQDNERPYYVGFTVGASQADLRAYMGGRSFGHAFELGYDWTKPDDFVGIRAYANHLRWLGDHSERLDVTQSLVAWRGGVEFSFTSPVKNLRPYTGLSITYWDGKRLTPSTVLGDYKGTAYPLPAGSYPDAEAKFGFRFGVDYSVFNYLTVSLDYNFSEWRSAQRNRGAETSLVNYAQKINGYNPVHPSWLGVSVKYKFDMNF